MASVGKLTPELQLGIIPDRGKSSVERCGPGNPRAWLRVATIRSGGRDHMAALAVHSRGHGVCEGGRTSILEGLMFGTADLNLREQAVEQLVAGTAQEVRPTHPAFL